MPRSTSPSPGPTRARLLAALLGLGLGMAGCSDDASGSGSGSGSGTAPGGGDDPGVDDESGETVIDPDLLEQMRAIGYVDVVEDMSGIDGLGVRLMREKRMADGYRFFTNVHNCSAQLIDAAGTVIRTWQLMPCMKWGNAVLREDGSVVTIHWNPVESEDAESLPDARELVQIGWDGEVQWKLPFRVHHDLDVLPDGRLALLTYEFRIYDWVDAAIPVRDDDIVMVGEDGQVLESASITDMLLAGPDAFTFQDVTPRDKDGQMEVDLLHANAVEFMYRPELAEQSPLYDADNVLVCVRNQDSVAVFDWSERRVIWSWGQGKLSGPHDATVLDNGNILVFDNGMGRRWSRVVEVDPRTDKVVWQYRAPERTDFFTGTRGAAERLPNGNTLVTESSKGRIFEVTPKGERVWEYINPNLSEEGQPIVVVRTRRLATDSPPFHRSD